MTYTEDSLVQQTTAEYMEQQFGWESFAPTTTRISGRTACQIIRGQPLNWLRLGYEVFRSLIFVTICSVSAKNRLYAVIFHDTGWNRGNYVVLWNVYNYV
jgi:hypothetical protein